jgi:hypothetical protein
MKRAVRTGEGYVYGLLFWQNEPDEDSQLVILKIGATQQTIEARTKQLLKTRPYKEEKEGYWCMIAGVWVKDCYGAEQRVLQLANTKLVKCRGEWFYLLCKEDQRFVLNLFGALIEWNAVSEKSWVHKDVSTRVTRKQSKLFGRENAP